MSRKRIPLNQNECTADFRICVPFEQNLQTLTEKKRNVVLLSYFMDMSDADIAREMNLVRSTINEHRRRSLELMRKNMEESANEKK